jgi:predicted AAA+ superfamily ATPase
VRQLIQVKDQLIFERFLKLLAGRVGQLINFDSLASDVGVSAKTIREWISVLEASFIVMRVAPYFKNFGKRLVKTPKIYFVDVGVACYLLGMESPHQVERDPLYGSLFENMVIMELVKARAARGQKPNLYFYRDSHGNEIDVLTEVARVLTPIEIKTSGTFQDGLIKSLNFYMSSIDRDCRQSYLIYAGSSGAISEVCRGLNFVDAAKSLLPHGAPKRCGPSIAEA